MTQAELARLFTPPDRKIALIRRMVIRVLEDEIRQGNQMVASAGPLQRSGYENWRNGLVRARFLVEELVDGDGKIVRGRLKELGVGEEEMGILTGEGDGGGMGRSRK